MCTLILMDIRLGKMMNRTCWQVFVSVLRFRGLALESRKQNSVGNVSYELVGSGYVVLGGARPLSLASFLQFYLQSRRRYTTQQLHL